MPGLQYLGLYAPPPVIPVGTPPVVIVTTVLPALVPGQPYTATILATGGQPPYVFALISGSLPPGLSFSSAGVISGTAILPTAGMTPTLLELAIVDTPYEEQVEVDNWETQVYPFTVRVLDEYGQQDDQAYSLTIFEASGVTFTVEGCVPPCLSVGPDGTIAGVPMKVGFYPITLVATDAGDRVVRQSYTLIVRPKP